MLSTLSKLEQVINNKTYHLLCDCDSPLSDIKEALFQFQKFVGNVEDQAKAATSQTEPVTPDIQPALEVPASQEPQQEPDIKPVE